MRGHWINDEEVFSATSLRDINPAAGEPLDEVALADEAQVKQAVAAASDALTIWRTTSPAERAEILSTAADLLREEYGDEGEATAIKKLIRDEVGKRVPEADLEVSESADVLSFFAENGARWLESERLALDDDLWPTKRSEVVYEPVGVVAIIKPWNYPLELPVWSIAAALIAGSAVVFKPSENSPLVGLWLAALLKRAGLPKGVFNVVAGDGVTGEALVKCSGVNLVSFTGSVDTGRQIAVECAKLLRPCKLELGGVDPAIVMPSVNLDLAVNGLTWGSFANAGQVRVRPKRIFIDKSVYETLLPRLVDRARELLQNRDFGPLISARQAEIVQEQVESSVAAGAVLETGGSPIDGPGFFFEPTVVSGVQPTHPLFDQECFGPVMALIPVANVQEAVELANSSEFGLGSSVWGEQESAEKLAKDVRAGMVWINDVNVAFPQAPWGGTKSSGYGVDLGRWGLEEYVIKKHVSVETGDATDRDWWFPYDE